MTINKKTIDLLKRVKTGLDASLNDLNPDLMKDLEKDLDDFGNNVQEMEDDAVREIQNSNLADEQKAYLIRFMKNSDSQIEDLLDFKPEFRKDEPVSSITDKTELEVGRDQPISPDIDKT